jgi:hypothetical protein
MGKLIAHLFNILYILIYILGYTDIVNNWKQPYVYVCIYNIYHMYANVSLFRGIGMRERGKG